MLTGASQKGMPPAITSGGVVFGFTLFKNIGYSTIHNTRASRQGGFLREQKLPALSPCSLLPPQPAQLPSLRVVPSPMRVQAATLRVVWMTAAVAAANARGSSGPRSSAGVGVGVGVGSTSSAFVGCAAAVVAPPEPFCECLGFHAVALRVFVNTATNLSAVLLVCLCANCAEGGGGVDALTQRKLGRALAGE